MKNNENATACSMCGGHCCKTMSCHLSPRDVFKNEEPSIEKLIAFLSSGNYSVDWWDGDVKGGTRSETYYVRPRHKGVPELFDPSWGGECIFLTENGCSLDWEHRPYGGKALVPSYEGGHRKCHSDYNKFECCVEWYPLQEMFDTLAEMNKLW